MRLILASASPARLSTLRNAGFNPQIIISEVDESCFTAPEPADLVAILARAKAQKVFAALGEPKDVVIIGCDSVLDFDGHPVGKPGTAQGAIDLLKTTRGKTGTLVTGHHVIVSTDHISQSTEVGKTIVHMGMLTDAEVEAYVATGEPIQVAGGFTIDGLGGAFVDSIEGDPHNVVGISLPLLRKMLSAQGIQWTDLWSRPA